MRAGILLVLLALAGCLSSGEPAQTAAVSAANEAPALPTLPAPAANLTSVEAPVWSVGDAWHVTSENGGETTQAVLVVTKADGSGYTLESTDAATAAYDAMFDVSYLGRIRASDLAGSQRDTPVQFFSFPLSDGKTWTTPWDGLEVALTATANPALPTPMGPQPGFAIVGTVEGEPYVEYSYVPALKWWTHISFAGGYGFKVDRVATNWTGTLATATASALFESDTVFPVATLHSSPFTVSEGQSFVALTLAGGGSAYARGLVVVDPNGTPYMTSTPNAEAMPQGGGVFYHERLPPTPGQWAISSPIAHAPDAAFQLTIHEVVEATRSFP